MVNSSYSSLIEVLRRIQRQQLFPILLWVIILATLFNFFKNGIYRPIIYPSVDFRLYHDWITHKGTTLDLNKFQAPFVSIPYSPLWGFILLPFVPFSFPIAKQMWFACNLSILLWFIYQSAIWFKKSLIFSKIPFLAKSILMILILNYMPTLATLRVGQANLLTFLFLVLSIIVFLKNHKTACGFFLALAILTKITPVFLLLYWLIKKEYRVVGSTIVSTLLLWLAAIPLTGLQLQYDYFRWISQYPFHILANAQVISNNMSLYALLADITKYLNLSPHTALILFLFYLLCIILFWYRCIISFGTKKNQWKEMLLEYGWTIALIPLLTHYTEDHHLTFLCLLYVSLFLFSDKHISQYYWILFVLSWICINGTFPCTDILISDLIPINLHYYNLYGTILVWITTTFFLHSIRNSGKIAMREHI